MKTKEKPNFSLSIPLVARLRAYAEDTRRKMSTVVEMALEAFLPKEKGRGRKRMTPKQRTDKIAAKHLKRLEAGPDYKLPKHVEKKEKEKTNKFHTNTPEGRYVYPISE